MKNHKLLYFLICIILLMQAINTIAKKSLSNDSYIKRTTWAKTMVASREKLQNTSSGMKISNWFLSTPTPPSKPTKEEKKDLKKIKRIKNQTNPYMIYPH